MLENHNSHEEDGRPLSAWELTEPDEPEVLPHKKDIAGNLARKNKFQFELAKALAVLGIKPSSFQVLRSNGQTPQVSTYN